MSRRVSVGVQGVAFFFLQMVSLWCASPFAAVAQTGDPPPSRVAECEVIIEQEHALGNGERTFSLPITVMRKDDGSYLLVEVAAQTVLQAYDAQGAPSFQFTGGEISDFGPIPLIHAWPGDSIAAWDPIRGRVLIYDAALRGPRVLEPVPLVRRAVKPLDGNLIVNADIRTPERAGLKLHALDSLGRITTSFDGTNRYRRSESRAHVRNLALAARGGIWSHNSVENLIIRWSSEGRALQTIALHDTWPDGLRIGAIQVVSLVEDDAGLWILAHVSEADGSLSTQVSVLDSVTGDAIASGSIDTVILGWVESRLGYSFDGVGDGTGRVTIWRPDLRCDENFP